MKTLQIVPGVVLAWGLMLCGSAAGEGQSAPVRQSEGRIVFLSGGIGLDERKAFLAARDEYNLLLTFATQGSGAYQSEVSLLVLDLAGKQVLFFDDVGPLFYAKLAPGAYRIQASVHGKVQAKSVRIGRTEGRALVSTGTPNKET